MASPVLKRDSPIIIVGAGAFGLSTALHLAERGYKKVTVFDKQPYDASLYSYFKGADAASADINKIVRTAYGAVTLYQDLSFEGVDGWKAWDEEIASGRTVPPGMTTADRVFIPNGNLSMTDADTLPQFERDTVINVEKAGYKTQLISGYAPHEELARQTGFSFGLDPFRRKQRGKSNTAVLDSAGGMAVADKACRFALHKARKLGVRFVLDQQAGAFESLCYADSSAKKIVGIKTRDGKMHNASLTIVACGGWTPAVIPQLDGLCEASAGSVVIYKIPKESPLWDRLGADQFPTWMWNMRNGAEGGLYGFPRDENGLFKIGYRGTKYTNPTVQADGKERSTPITRWSDGEKLTTIPTQALKVISNFVNEYLPELGQEGITIHTTRICWYNDSYDNHLVIDRVPDTDGLMVATAGSGHAFKYMPCIGKWMADIAEGIGLDRPAVQAWKWRARRVDEAPINVLMEGKAGKRALGNVPLVSQAELAGGTARSRL